jgi:small subunit ribosomal protein S15
MVLSASKKEAVFEQYRRHETDTGSFELQIAVLSTRISELTEHLKLNPKDFACRRGLQMLVGRRRRLMNYAKRKLTEVAYKELLAALGIRK